jgi:glutamate synthase (NADPH/NADH) small chain
VQVEWTKNDKGQFIPKNVPGTEKVLPAQLVLLAMGFLGPEQPLLESLGIERDARSNAKADFEKYTTNLKGVLPAAIVGAARASWCGRSTKAVARRANATVSDGRDGFAVAQARVCTSTTPRRG